MDFMDGRLQNLHIVMARRNPALTWHFPGETKSRPAEQLLTNISGNVEIQEMDRMRRLIAEHMVRSKQTSPHVTSFSEADVTNLVNWREKEKEEFEKREGTKLTLTPLFIEALVRVY